MLLFLDFDGVLHPAIGRRIDFCHRQMLEDWLILNQEVSVVISSSWRQMMSMEELKGLFTPILRDRILSKCPNSSKNGRLEFPWYEEIMEWIYLNEYTGSWAALDDAFHEFPEGLKNLVVCDGSKGLTEKNLNDLTDKIYRQDNE